MRLFTIFRTKHPKLITITDSILLADGKHKYVGEINFDMSLPQLDLTSIAWETLKGSTIGMTYGFNCLVYLETVDKSRQEVSELNKDLVRYMSRTSILPSEGELIHQVRSLIEYEKLLQQLYSLREDELANCD